MVQHYYDYDVEFHICKQLIKVCNKAIIYMFMYLHFLET